MIRLNEAWLDGPVADPPPGTAAQLVEGVFRAGGWLEAELGLEHRPQQLVMARRTLEAWEREEGLFFEAGTGVGKSLAYLVPGLIRARLARRPLVVSTHTIALQEQIEHKDLPLCRKLFSCSPGLEGLADFRHAVLLGRGNYLCGARLGQALRARSELFPSSAQQELERIAEWSRHTQTGLLQELDPQPLPEVWDWVQADGHACNPRNCHPRSCFFRRAREAVRKADLIVVNHSLLFALLAAGHFPQGDTPGILFPEDFLVLDEAHTLPSIATDYFGMRLSSLGLKRQLQKLYHRGAGKPRGLLLRQGSAELRQQVSALAARAEAYFQGLRRAFLQAGRPFRLTVPDWAENPLDLPLRELVHGIKRTASRIEEGPEQDELEGAGNTLGAYRESLREAHSLGDPEAVYWLECGGVKGTIVHLRSAPLEVAGPLRERLFERNTGLLLTSATLAEGPEMSSFKGKLGAPEVAGQQVASPFDYPLQMEILIHAGAPGPSETDNRLDPDFLAGEIGKLALEVEGGSLILFTSYRDLEAVGERLAGCLRCAGRELLQQGRGLGRRQLLERMREAGNAVLLGTDSFWTGVDLPGPALSQVVITRLPFENPTHPVAEARAERCRQEGRSPFAELVLPAALVKFRQGLGRLIRNQTDSGRLVILDSRILDKPYGRVFLDVLPHPGYRTIGGPVA